ncbi:LOW QUALITY PROTEIN: hypothetical protein KUTeg_003372, partial [Tegillarca granosa]
MLKVIQKAPLQASVFTVLSDMVSYINDGLHSLRSGGDTTADVNERCIKCYGRWSRDTSKDMYIVDSVESRAEFYDVILLDLAKINLYE